MTPKRPKELKWIGKNLPDGRPVQFVNDVEPRDYDETETAALTQDQLASARGSGLYREVHAPEPKKAKATKPAAPEPATNDVVADESLDAAEPATEGDGS